jgi:hypothetical protein
MHWLPPRPWSFSLLTPMLRDKKGETLQGNATFVCAEVSLPPSNFPSRLFVVT